MFGPDRRVAARQCSFEGTLSAKEIAVRMKEGVEAGEVLLDQLLEVVAHLTHTACSETDHRHQSDEHNGEHGHPPDSSYPGLLHDRLDSLG